MSGWTNVTVEPVNKSEMDPVASSEPEQDPGDVVKSYIERNFDSDDSGVPRLTHRAHTFQITRGSNGKSYARQILDECDAANRVLVIGANDTSDSGSGWLYERDGNGGIREVDSWSGYEGARGHDVRGYFADEYGVHGTANPMY